MKVLWITNIIFPEASEKLFGETEFKSSGGWMLGAANALLNSSGVKLCVATVSPMVKKLKKIQGDRILYYVIPLGKGNLKENIEYQDYWKQINLEFTPDVVHIHGTEYSHGYAFMKACGVDNVVISIQGLKSTSHHYYYYGISKLEIYRNITLRDILRGSMIKDQQAFEKSSNYEIQMIQMTNHVIGRTSWDKAKTWAINPEAEYHFCNETLRDEFYDGSFWEYKKCTPYSIFLSQAGYPIKGLHQLLKAMPLILRHYPDTTIRIAGYDITKCNTLQDFVHFTGYGKYICRIIRKFHLNGKIAFVGSLNAEEMKREYLNCNVFVCPSSIENSPNSLGEAQILGVPCVASYVGGVPDMMAGNEENLYRFDDVEMLAHKVIRVFNDGYRQTDMRNFAIKRHDRISNAQELLSIYNKIKLV